MKLVLFLAVLPFAAHASRLNHDHRHLARRDHSHLAHRANSNHINKRRGEPRSINIPTKAGDPYSSSSSSTTSSSPSFSKRKSPGTSGGVAAQAKGLLNVVSDCGKIGATENVTATTGPNGSEDWLNCGLHDSGWRPPHVQVNDLITEDLGKAISSPDSPFIACSRYVPLFEKYAQEHSIPSILLAAFALQESSCKADATGGGGEQGLMQITKDKCDGAPDGNCQDPDFNIKTGAQFFADTLKANEGNVIKTIGMYNGWRPGMTFGDATAAGSGSCCRCQNNLDYIQQFVNGWLMNMDVYSGKIKIGSYFNLDKCGN